MASLETAIAHIEAIIYCIRKFFWLVCKYNNVLWVNMTSFDSKIISTLLSLLIVLTVVFGSCLDPYVDCLTNRDIANEYSLTIFSHLQEPSIATSERSTFPAKQAQDSFIKSRFRLNRLTSPSQTSTKFTAIISTFFPANFSFYLKDPSRNQFTIPALKSLRTIVLLH